jgi:hypothetical protein
MESPEIRKYTGLAALILAPLLALVVTVYVLRARRREGRAD